MHRFTSCNFAVNLFKAKLCRDHFAVRVASTARTARARQRNYYDVLGVSKSATDKEIKSAYFKLSKQCHPDSDPTNPNLHERFVEVNDAYMVLGKSDKRKEYDLSLERPQRNYSYNSSNGNDAYYRPVYRAYRQHTSEQWQYDPNRPRQNGFKSFWEEWDEIQREEARRRSQYSNFSDREYAQQYRYAKTFGPPPFINGFSLLFILFNLIFWFAVFFGNVDDRMRDSRYYGPPPGGFDGSRRLSQEELERYIYGSGHGRYGYRVPRNDDLEHPRQTQEKPTPHSDPHKVPSWVEI